ncbi:hypothetical protein DVH24_033917 [Malus domestica]|uniref:Uncharacterized protein n=1 Tax=Malus domestica TaxID=3750 RepID=A0A498KMB5_MALDO|nr:hypothetical protein DVH24_033917 [Malus domestica]
MKATGGNFELITPSTNSLSNFPPSESGVLSVKSSGTFSRRKIGCFVTKQKIESSSSKQQINFSPIPKSNILATTSWDNQRLLVGLSNECWEIHQSGQNLASVANASIPHDQPVLCSTWKDDGSTVFSGGCDEQVKSGLWLRLLGIPEEMNYLVTGNWDKTTNLCKPSMTSEEEGWKREEARHRCKLLQLQGILPGSSIASLIYINFDEWSLRGFASDGSLSCSPMER